MNNFFKNIKDNKGSGIMTVMLAVLFLTAFGSLALYLTYTSFQVAASDRYSKEVTYNANTCMEEVKAGIQDIVSDAIEETYRAVMPEYTISAGNISKKFSDSYFDQVIKWTDKEGNKLFVINKNAAGEFVDGFYTAEAVKSLIKERRGAGEDDVTVVGQLDGGVKGKAIVKKDSTNKPIAIILEGIQITFKGREGRKSTVTADIKIGVPNIGYLLTQYAISGIPEFSFVCNGTLKQTTVSGFSTPTQILGSGYVGAIELANNTRMIVDSSSTLICKGNITVNGTDTTTNHQYGRFYVSDNSTLWAGNISIGPQSSAKLLGTAYVANDLVFNGNGAYARVAGEYHGFGCSSTDATRSSSIISNRSGGIIDTLGLEQLTLAGVSFIMNDEDLPIPEGEEYEDTIKTYAKKEELIDKKHRTNTSVRMGESLSVKYNQQLYFAPYDSIIKCEPQVVSSGEGYEIISDTHGYYIYHDLDEGTYTCFAYTYVLGEDGNPVLDEDGNPIISSSENWDYYEDVDPSPVFKRSTLEGGQSKETVMTKEEFFAIDHFELATGTVPGLNKTYEEYGITLKPVFKWFGDDKVVVYFFMNFDSQIHANEYFIDSFKADVAKGTNKISQNMDSYLLNWSSFGGKAAKTMGAFYTDYNSVTGRYLPATLNESDMAELRTAALFREQIFNNFCKTLTNVVKDSNATNPFEYYIHESSTEDIPKPGITDILSKNERMNFYNGSKLTAVVVNGDYTYSGTNPDLCLIISTGSVTFEADFSGLVLCKGDVILNGKVTFTNSSESVLNAFTADSGQDTAEGRVNGEYLIKDLFNVNILEQSESSESVAGDAWNVASLVTFSKWNRS